MKVLDTTFLIDVMRGEKQTKSMLDKNESLFTTQVNMYEIIRGIFLRGVTEKKLAEVLEMFESIHVLPLDDSAVIKAANISAGLIKKGMPVADCDCMTAGIALSKGMSTIVTRNVKHFRRMKEIKVEAY